MLMLSRKSWFRILVAFFCIVLAAIYSQFTDDKILREGLARALQASTVLFAVSAALSLALLNNYINGLKDASLKRIADAKSLLEKIFDEFRDTKDASLKEIVEVFVLPLLSLSTEDWLSYHPLKPIMDRVGEPIVRVHESNKYVVARYFLRVEDEINELSILYIRRAVSGLHTDVIKGVFFLLCVGVVGFLLVAILPYSPVSNFVCIASSVAIIVFAIFEMLILVSYLMQEAFEELPNFDEDEDEDLAEVR